MIDDALTEGASRSSAAVRRAQGHYIWASTGNPELLVTMNVVLTSGPCAPVREPLMVRLLMWGPFVDLATWRY